MPDNHSSSVRKEPNGKPASKARYTLSSGSADGSTIQSLRCLLGDDVVLLPCGKGEKGSRWEKWQEITIGKMGDEHYLRALNRAHNIAVLLGNASGGLCTIDIDGDESIEPFLALNPRLKETLRSRGKRGCNLWVRIRGNFPCSSMLKRQDGGPWGEWRSDRFCTMIHGVHPEGMNYERSPEVPPVEIEFEEIVWPADLILPWKLDRANNETQPSADKARKWTAAEVGEMLACIPARPDYDQWLRVSSAVWSELGETEGTAVLRAWSPDEKPGEYDEKFTHRLERVTAGTLVHIAKQHGWRGNAPVRSDVVPTMTPEEAVAAILGACQRGQYACTGDTLCFEWEGCGDGAIIHLDTEQSGGDWHALVRRSVKRSGLPSVSDRLLSIPLVRFARSERLNRVCPKTATFQPNVEKCSYDHYQPG